MYNWNDDDVRSPLYYAEIIFTEKIALYVHHFGSHRFHIALCRQTLHARTHPAITRTHTHTVEIFLMHRFVGFPPYWTLHPTVQTRVCMCVYFPPFIYDYTVLWLSYDLVIRIYRILLNIYYMCICVCGCVFVYNRYQSRLFSDSKRVTHWITTMTITKKIVFKTKNYL